MCIKMEGLEWLAGPVVKIYSLRHQVSLKLKLFKQKHISNEVMVHFFVFVSSFSCQDMLLFSIYHCQSNMLAFRLLLINNKQSEEAILASGVFKFKL